MAPLLWLRTRSGKTSAFSQRGTAKEALAAGAQHACCAEWKCTHIAVRVHYMQGCTSCTQTNSPGHDKCCRIQGFGTLA